MSLRLFTDSSANLPEGLPEKMGITVIPLTLLVNGKEEILCFTPNRPFDGDAFYERLRQEADIELKTSMVNDAAFTEAFLPALEAGDDVLYVAMSSGISGTYAAGERAARELKERFPQREIEAVDTHAASMGEGQLVLEAAALIEKGKTAAEIKEYLLQRRESMRQHFLVDDLQFLKRGGRIRGAAALMGTIMNIKPIMQADELGRIVLDRKVISRKKALKTLAAIFDDCYEPGPHNCQASIAHGGCEKDAKALVALIRERHPEVTFTIVCYEPGTGAHVGPDTVALFLWGQEKKAESEGTIPAIKAKIAAEAHTIKEEISQKLPFNK